MPTYFQDWWLTYPKFKDWIKRGKDSKTAYCTIFPKSITLTETMCTSALTSHVLSGKHKTQIGERNKLNNFFAKRKTSSAESVQSKSQSAPIEVTEG